MTHRSVTVRQICALLAVLVAELDIGPYEHQPCSTVPGCTERLLA